MKRLGIILTLLCLCIPAFGAQIITATVTVTNTAGTSEGETLTVNGVVRTWRTTIVTPASDIQATNTIGGAATNLFRHVAASRFPGLNLSMSGTNGIYLGTAPAGSLSLSVSLSSGWGTVVLTTNTTIPGTVARIPFSDELAAQQTNVTSGIVAMVDADQNTNAIRESSLSVSNLVGRSNTQTISGAKTLTGANVYGNAAQLFTGGTITNVVITNAIALSGITAKLTNGTYQNPLLVNGTNSGKAFSSPGSGTPSEQFGAGALATGPYNLALGIGAVASNYSATAIGNQSVASQDYSGAFGTSARALAVNSLAIGGGSLIATNHFNSTALGVNAVTTTSNQLRLATANESVSIPGNLTVNGSITNATFAGMANFPSGSDIAFSRFAITSIANGDNSAIAVGTNTFIELSGATAAFSTSGFANGRDGKWIVVLHRDGFPWTIKNESGLDVPANRVAVLSGSDLVLPGSAAAVLIYNVAASRWHVVTTSAGGTGGGGATNAIANTNGFGYGTVTLETVVATNFVGNGAGLTNLSVSGSSGIATNSGTGINNTLTNLTMKQTTSAGLRTNWIDIVTGGTVAYDNNTAPFGWHYSDAIYSPSFIGNATLLTNVNVSKLSAGNTSTSNRWVGSFFGDGAGLTNFNGDMWMTNATDGSITNRNSDGTNYWVFSTNGNFFGASDNFDFLVGDGSTTGQFVVGSGSWNHDFRVKGDGTWGFDPMFTGTTNKVIAGTGVAYYGNGVGLTNLPPTAITNAPWITSASLTDATNHSITVSGTANRVTVSGSPVFLGGTVTLSGPQDIGTSSSPTFSGLKLSGLSPSKLARTDSNTNIVSAATSRGLSFDGTTLQIDSTVITNSHGRDVTLAGTNLFLTSGVTARPSQIVFNDSPSQANSTPQILFSGDAVANYAGIGTSTNAGYETMRVGSIGSPGDPWPAFLLSSLPGSSSGFDFMVAGSNTVLGNIVAGKNITTTNGFFTGNGIGLTNLNPNHLSFNPLLNGQDIAQSGLHDTNLDYPTWVATLKAQESGHTFANLNRFSWINTYKKIRSGQSFRVLRIGDGLAQNGMLLSASYKNLTNVFPSAGFASDSGELAKFTLTVSSNASVNNQTFTYLKNYAVITNTGGTASFTHNSTNDLADTFAVFYVKDTGLGHFNVQTQINGGTWTTVSGLGNVDASSGSTIGAVATWTNATPIQCDIRVIGNDSSKTVYILDAAAINSTITNGFIYADYYGASFVTMEQMVGTASILTPIFSYWNPDLILFEKIRIGDAAGSAPPYTVTNFDNFITFIHTNNPMADVVFAGLYPVTTNSLATFTDAEVVTNTLHMRDLAQRYNWALFDGHTPFGDAEAMFNRALLDTDRIHGTTGDNGGFDTYDKLLSHWLALPDFVLTGSDIAATNVYVTNLFATNIYSTNIYGDTFKGKVTITTNLYATNIFTSVAYVTNLFSVTNAFDNLTVTNGVTNLSATASTVAVWDANKRLGSLSGSVASGTALTIGGAFTNTGPFKTTTNYVDKLYLSSDTALYRQDSSTIATFPAAGAIGFRGYDLTFDDQLINQATNIIINATLNAFLKSVNSTNGFGTDGTHFTKAPTNAPTDGQVVTATGTSGATKWAAASLSAQTNLDNLTVTNGITSLIGNKGALTVGAFGASPSSYTNTSLFNVQIWIDDISNGATTFSQISVNSASTLPTTARYIILQPGEWITVTYTGGTPQKFIKAF